MGYEKQIGIIVPSSGIVTEMLFHRYAPPYIGISTARVKFNHISFQGLSDMLELVGGVAADLCCVEPNIIVFSSIMAGAINGKSITTWRRPIRLGGTKRKISPLTVGGDIGL